jgi:hypothetical protein
MQRGLFIGWQNQPEHKVLEMPNVSLTMNIAVRIRILTIPIWDDVGNMMKKHSNSLREFRNNVFHLRENPEVVRQFFANDKERLPWAPELHAAIARFFSEHHILCEVHYTMHSRKTEIDSNRKLKHRSRRSLS